LAALAAAAADTAVAVDVAALLLQLMLQIEVVFRSYGIWCLDVYAAKRRLASRCVQGARDDLL